MERSAPAVAPITAKGCTGGDCGYLRKPVSTAAAPESPLIPYVLANPATMYALGWDITRYFRAATLAGVPPTGLEPFALRGVSPLPAFCV